MPPTTGTPMSDSPWRAVSSSNTATGTCPATGVRSISRMASAPASRLPITATRRPTRWVPRCQAKRRDWNRNTPMAMVRKEQPMRITSSGTRSKGGLFILVWSTATTSSHTSLKPASTTSDASAESSTWRASCTPA